MNRTVGLGPALLAAGIYALLVGFILLFPPLTEAVFGRKVTDPAVEAGWGSSLLGLGVVTLAIGRNVERYGGLAWTLVVALLIISFVLLYYFITGAYTARNAIVPLIINALLIAWIWSVRPKS